MCGILGFIDNRWQDHVESAIATLSSRGPDEQTVVKLGEAILAHTRLAVIDTEGGHQPMQSSDGRYTLVFNGEIYNYMELRRELENHGIAFTTRSDTEVLLHSLITWGESLFPRLDGMFAFAIWDSRERTLLAARDAVGIKPLVYSTAGGGIIFSSTMAPFLAIPDFPGDINPEGLRDYLAFGAFMAPHSFLQEVHHLPPAGVLRYDVGKNEISIKRWWSIPPADPAADSSDALERVEIQLRENVRRQMVSDVPLGTFLSGGVDSSLIVRYMTEFYPGRLKTFSMRFETDQFDESSYAQEVSNRFDTDHHIFEASTIDGGGLVTAIGALDQPLADPAYIMTYFLARHTREHVTVAISGDGGDELFGGYPYYLNVEDLYPERWWQKPMRSLIERGFLTRALLRHSLWGREFLYYRRKLGPLGKRKWLYVLQPDFASRSRPQKTMEGYMSLIDKLGGRLDSGMLMRADLHFVLSEMFLVKTDRASMAHGLEVRVPFLGFPMLSTALSLPPDVHFQHGLKTLLIALARRELPRCVWDRPKHGFAVPIATYLRGPWREVGDDIFAECSTLAPFLNAEVLKTLWEHALTGPGESKTLLYRLFILLVWMRENSISA